MLLRGGVLGGAGLAAAALVGCGDDDDDDDDDDTVAATATPTAPVAGDDDDAATGDDDDTVATGPGQVIRDPDLPYPYQFPDPAGTPKPGGTMNVGVTWDIATFDPTLSAAGGTITVPNYTYNRLIGMVQGTAKDPFTIELEPELAASWERTPDGATFTFNIRDDVKWQNVEPLNGRPFTANDVKFAYDRYAAEGVHRSYWANISSTEAVDDFTFKANMGSVTADFILPLASRYQTIFPRELVDDGTITQRAVGTGPMIMVEAEQGNIVRFEKNPEYFRREVLLDGVDARIMADHSARLAAFRVGQLDYAYSIANTLPLLETLLETNPDVQINVSPVVNGGIPFGMNLSNPKFQDERVRQAITLAIDTELMEELVYDNLSKTLPLHPWTFVFDEEPTVESGNLGRWFGRYDPAEAKKLLEAAGASDLSFDAIYFVYGQYITDQTEIVLSNFNDVGINMNARSVDYTEFNSTWVPGKLEEGSTSAWLTVGFDADNFFFNSVHSESPGNRWQLKDPQVDAWAEQQSVELDPDARREIHREMWDHFLEQMYWPPMPSAVTLQVYQPWLRAIRFGGLFGSSSSYYDWGAQVESAWLDK
jgi:ABC-type transport system substrate-binding protein